jgi:hypothetical protein
MTQLMGEGQFDWLTHVSHVARCVMTHAAGWDDSAASMTHGPVPSRDFSYLIQFEEYFGFEFDFEFRFRSRDQSDSFEIEIAAIHFDLLEHLK